MSTKRTLRKRDPKNYEEECEEEPKIKMQKKPVSLKHELSDTKDRISTESESGSKKKRENKSLLTKQDFSNIKAEISTDEVTLPKDIQSSSKAIANMFVGAHVSAAGGAHNAVTNAVKISCKAFALFLKSQRQWNAKPLEEKSIKLFKDSVKEHGFSTHLILPHGSYLINCGSPDSETYSKSRQALIDEMKRCEQLGLALFNFHPGSTCGKQTVEKSISQIAECINEALQKTSGVTAVLENMSCQGNTIGGKFEEIRAIIDLVNDKSRVGVCLDTCHAFAAGFDLSCNDGYESMMNQFESVIGLKYLKGVHLNDSKGDLGCHLDRHECIGKGKLGLETFRRIMNDQRFYNIPLILETPDENSWEKEIEVLYSLQDKK